MERFELGRLDGQGVVLTANRRQTRVLRDRYAAQQLAAAETVWESPRILPWGAWLIACYDRLLLQDETLPLLLGEMQEVALWESVLLATPLGRDLDHPLRAVERVREAWQMLHGWCQPLPESASWSREVDAFVDWARRFQRRCSEAGWLDLSRLPQRLQVAFGDGLLAAPERLHLVGFDSLTPQQEALLEALRGCGCRVESESFAAPASNAVRLACDDARDEVEQAARWARALLQEEPSARIALVVPDLEERAGLLARRLDQTLIPQEGWCDSGVQRPWNLSLGSPLSEVPLLRDLFFILDLAASGRLPLQQASALLRSPWLAGAEEEAAARALLDLELRRRGEPQVRLETLHWLAGGKGEAERPYASSHLERSLRALLQWRRDGAQRDPPLLGWPRGRSLDSTEYQAWQAWDGVVQQLPALEQVVRLADFSARVRWLRRIAERTLFQPRSGAAPLQVLGLLEAAGLDFDHLWIMGLHDAALPPPAHPNPFLPLPLQRRCAMPHASAARELAFARRLFARLCSAAPEVICSHPLRDGDRELLPSPLLNGMAAAAPRFGSELQLAAQRLHGQQSSELWSDESGPELVAGSALRGGARALQLQAACPFRAFAELRLRADVPEAVADGPDPRWRGSLLHDVLQRLWLVLESHAGLCSLQQRGGLDDAIEQALAAAIEAARSSLPRPWGEQWLGQERLRLRDLLRQLLAIEQGREPFVVEELEAGHEVEFGGLRLRLRGDRVDRLDDGGRILIDYKSGDAKPTQWLGPRPDEPQLPLYAVTSTSPVAALAFVVLRRGHCEFRGVGLRESLARGVKTGLGKKEEVMDIDQLQEQWKKTLELLAEALRRGEAQVDPKGGRAGACSRCDLALLCRIDSALALDDGEAVA